MTAPETILERARLLLLDHPLMARFVRDVTVKRTVSGWVVSVVANGRCFDEMQHVEIEVPEGSDDWTGHMLIRTGLLEFEKHLAGVVK